LKSKFKRLDKLSAIGEYGVLLLGLSDVASPSDFAQPVQGQGLKLNYVKPYSQQNASIQTYQTDPKDPRYGLPLLYEINMARSNARGNEPTLVHHTRVIHVTGELLESETHGKPELEAGWNRLKDLEKVMGSSAEAFWLNVRGLMHFNVQEGKKLAQGDWDNLKEQLDEVEHGFRRALRTKGVDLNQIKLQITDPSKHVDVLIQALSAVYEIPKRILTGSERGELSSAQDRTEWMEKIQTRREERVEEQIVRPFVDVCIRYGVLPEAGAEGYDVVWSDLFTPSEKDKAEVAQIRSKALESYAKIPGMQDLFPFDLFVQYVLNMPDEVNDKIQAALEEMERVEQETGPTPEEEAELERQQQQEE
jgi:hypothetical protein